METQFNFSSYRDDQNVVRILNHNQAPVRKQTKNPLQLAKEYIQEAAGEYRINSDLLKELDKNVGITMSDEGESFKLKGIKKMLDSTVVDYAQTYYGLPVWRSGLTVVMQDEPLQVLSSSNSSQMAMKVHKPKIEVAGNGTGAYPYLLYRAVGIPGTREENDFKINENRLVIFKYEAAKRYTDHPGNEQEKNRQQGFVEEHFTIPLPPVADSIKDGEFYVVHEVLFTYSLPGKKKLNWRAMIEAETNSVLYLRALTDNLLSGMVFKCDPITDSGSTSNNPNASSATLDGVRVSVALPGLVAPSGGQQALTGEYVRVIDDEAPTVAPPTEGSPYDFNYGSRTNNFVAVNAYYHCDKFFRMLHDLGFDIPSYFDGTTFPVHIDHRGHFGTANGIEVNASCNGNAASNGIGLVDFELATLADTSSPVGIAVDFKVVLHELGGHGILWDHVDGPNFGFCHSAGDSIAVITNDPDSNAPDRFETFPFSFYTFSPSSRRRHDRTLAAGWGWGGSQDDGGYGSEQIMSTTMFRIYRSIGGDHWDLSRRQLASKIAVYLIVRAVGTLTPASNPSDPAGFETALENADAGNFSFLNPAESYAGGAYYKVIRWAFEKQALYRPSGVDATHEGNPPAVDVYINDGRNGEYQFLANHWSCTDIWNRRNNTGDGSGVHEEPIVGQTNYAWVKIKNRGTQTATNIVVKGYHAKPGVGLTYPDDWMAMDTNQLVASNLASGAEQIVGPFEWVPSEVGHECMFMSVSALHDPSNIDGRITGSIPEWRVVPNDNNIAQRNVSPVSGSSNLNLVASMANLPFWARNPNSKESKITLDVHLPVFLEQRGWRLDFSNAGGRSFNLQPGGERKIEMRMIEGKPFTKQDVLDAKDDNKIVIYANADGNLIGGMTYNVDPDMKHPSNYHEPKEEDCGNSIKDWLKMAEASGRNVKSVKVKRITLDIDFRTDCDCD
ncbi:MAG TPA: hypothetical protein PKM63_01285 [Panacibacter sp.]|nr:hypothetical protein [Panacibacter sp.]HNP42887.1 hypothetical protein [Panacibacter sp.]